MITEEVMPLSTNASPRSSIAGDNILSIRLIDEREVDPESVQAVVERNGVRTTGGEWRPTTPGDNTDGWAVFVPQRRLPAGAVTLTVTAATLEGDPIGPIVERFQIGQRSTTPNTVEVEEESGLPQAHGSLDNATYRISPMEVYDEPVAIQIPVAANTKLRDVTILYYSESTEHPGWYPADAVKGWMVPGSARVVWEDNQAFIEFQVNHGGIVALGRATR